MHIKKQLILLAMLLCGFTATWAAQKVTVAATQNGTVVVDKPNATAGETVTVTVTPATDYQIAKSDIVVEATIDPGSAQVPGLKAEGPGVGLKIELQGDDPSDLRQERTYTFVMPEAPLDVLITATFKGVTYYNVTIDSNIENGSVEADKNRAVEGETVTLTVTPATGYELDELYYMNGNDKVTITGTSFQMPAADVVVHATFKAIDYAITVTEGIENGSVTAPATAQYGQEVTVTVTPATGYELETLTYTAEGGNPVAIENNKFNMPAANVTINATFKAIDYTITVAQTQNGTVTAPATAQYGQEVTVTVTPATGYVLETLTYTAEGGNPVAIENNKFTMPAANVTINATFKAVDYTITVAEGIENGNVTAPATAQYGQEVNVTVTPATGYVLETLTYTAEGGNPVAIENNKFNMPAANVTINATFKAIDYTITVAEGIENGGVTAPATAQYGQEVTVTVTPATGYELETLTYTAEGGEPMAIENNKFTMPAANVTINATFKAIDYTITVAEGIENGTVEVPATAQYGQEVTVTVTPATGYVLETLTYTAEGGEPVPIENNKFNMPAANVTINATFKAIDYTITVAEGIENGTVEAPATAHYGQEVNVTVTPDEGYELDELVVMPAYNSVTCAEVIAGADDMIYRVSGKITHISSMEYGNLFLADNTGEIFIYGTLDKEGNTNNFESLGLKEGDYVIVEGPKTTYQGIVELIDVTVVGVEIETNVTGNGYTFTMPACDVVVSATFKSTSHTYTVAGEPATLTMKMPR